jgi:hypothetical protein
MFVEIVSRSSVEFGGFLFFGGFPFGREKNVLAICPLNVD